MKFLKSPANKRIQGYHSGPKIYGKKHSVFSEISQKRVRLKFNDIFVVDSHRPLLVYENGHLPIYYFPKNDIETMYLSKAELTTTCPYKGDATYWKLNVNEKESINAAWSYEEPVNDQQNIKGLIAFYWDSIDHWFEEDEEIFSHPKDPYVRLDAIKSNRKIKILIDEILIAESIRNTILFQTGLPPQYYFPKDAIIPELVALNFKSRCAYRGTADHYSIYLNNTLYENIAWSFTNPTPEMIRIKDLICFDYNKITSVIIDSKRT